MEKFAIIPEGITAREWLIFAMTISAYLILIRGIVITKGKGQNFFTWLLWGILDLVLYLLINEEKGISTMLVFACVFGSFTSALFLFKYKKNWGLNESRVLFFVFILIVLMLFQNSVRTIIIFAVISELVAGWPLLKDTWKNPDDSGYTLTSYLVFLMAYILTIYENFVTYPTSQIFGEKFVENMLFPLAFIIYSFFDTFPLLKKWLNRE